MLVVALVIAVTGLHTQPAGLYSSAGFLFRVAERVASACPAPRKPMLCAQEGAMGPTSLTRYELPSALPAFVKTESGGFISHREATLVQWRHHGSKGNDKQIVDQLVVSYESGRAR
jgi:hypothetical protein